MRFVAIFLSFVGLLLVAALIGPSFVDWNKHKPTIISQVKSASGLDVQIGGNLSLAVLPSPRVKIENLVVAAPKKIQFENLLTMKSAEVSVALLPLLSGKIEVGSIRLIAPDIQVEIMPDGTPSWESEKFSKVKETGGALSNVAPEEMKSDVKKAGAQALDAISIGRLEIEEGKLHYIDHQTKASYAASNINLDVKADSLKGPFVAKGDLTYDEKMIALRVKTGALPKGDEAFNVSVGLTVPEADADISFDGVTAITKPYDLQGQTNISLKSPQKLAKLFNVALTDAYDEKFTLNGLLSANTDKVEYNDLKLSFGDFVSSGKISVQNLDHKNPLNISASLKSSSVLNVDPFLESSSTTLKTSETESLKKAGTSSSVSQKKSGLIPQSLVLPMPMDVTARMDVAGLKVKGQNINGFLVDIKKRGASSDIRFNVLEVPGQGKIEGALTASFGSSSKSPKTGQVVYSDPSVSYKVSGQVGKLKEFLKSFAPKADTNAVIDLYRTAQFNLQGRVNQNAVSLKDSTLTLDQMVVGLGGRYQPAVSGTRAKAIIDVTAGAVDFDRIMQAKGGKKSSANDGSATMAASTSSQESLKPIQGFSLPLDLGFDVSLQKARINGADLNGLRLTGDLTGKALTLKNASVNNFAGAALSLKGTVDDLSVLSGLDLSFYTKTENLQNLLQALKVDASKLPKGLKAVEANVTGKGSLNKIIFASNVKAMKGQLDATGSAGDILGKPSFDNLTVRLRHPNLVQAIKIVSPSFSGQAGLQQAVDFYTKASSKGAVYSLSDMRVSLGKTSLTGNLNIDTGASVPIVRGAVKGDRIALDNLLGAKTSSASTGGAGSVGSKSNSSTDSSKERWSKAPIDLSWMSSVDVDVALSANSITHGAWNFSSPSTSLKIGNGQMTVSDMKAGVFGGQATLNTEVKSSPVRLDLKSRMSNINLELLAKALSGGNKLKSTGTVSFDTSVNSTGGSAHSLINALNGTATLEGNKITLEGFDLAKLARGLAVEEKLATSITSLIDGATSGGQTQFDTLKGSYKIDKGQVNIQSMQLDGPAAVIDSTGYANLPKWFINVDNKITLKNVEGLDPFDVKIKGPIDNPSDTFGKNILEDYLADKLKRKIGKEIPKILGDDVGNALEQFGIIPKQQKAPTQQQPANDNTPQEAPAQQQQEQPKKADPLQQILENPGEAEDALKGVLEGLF